MRTNSMAAPSPLLIDRPDGEQVVRGPRRSDAIGALLQRVYAVRRVVPDAITRLLSRIDASDDGRDQRITGRR